MERFKLEFMLHWIWAAVFGLLLITGLALLGPKFGWALSYNLGMADYLHRTLAAVFAILTLAETVLEIRRELKAKGKKEPWLVIGKNGFALVTFITAQLFIISGILLWTCIELENNHAVLALASIVHEMTALAMIAGLVWHVYDKSHVLILGSAKVR